MRMCLPREQPKITINLQRKDKNIWIMLAEGLMLHSISIILTKKQLDKPKKQNRPDGSLNIIEKFRNLSITFSIKNQMLMLTMLQ